MYEIWIADIGCIVRSFTITLIHWYATRYCVCRKSLLCALVLIRTILFSNREQLLLPNFWVMGPFELSYSAGLLSLTILNKIKISKPRTHNWRGTRQHFDYHFAKHITFIWTVEGIPALPSKSWHFFKSKNIFTTSVNMWLMCKSEKPPIPCSVYYINLKNCH